MKNKKTVVALTAILTVLVFIGVFLMIWFVGDTYKDFKNNFRKEFEIEGLKDGAATERRRIKPSSTSLSARI